LADFSSTLIRFFSRMDIKNLTQKDVMSPDVLSRLTFCSTEVMSPEVLSPRSFFLLDVLSLRMFCPAGRNVPPEILSMDALSPDVLSGHLIHLSLPEESSRVFHLGLIIYLRSKYNYLDVLSMKVSYVSCTYFSFSCPRNSAQFKFT
jgi:hypothetical protein